MNHRSRPSLFRAAAALFLVSSFASVAAAASGRHGDDQVTVFSDNTVAADDSIDGNAVAVFGDLTVNGTVHGDAVAVLGNLTLGPGADVDGDVVCVAGKLHLSPDARVEGRVVRQGLGAPFYFLPSWRVFWLDGFHSYGVWLFNLGILALYALVALVFPRGIRQCGETLMERPGLSILASFLTLLALPVLFVLLLITIVGIPVAIIVLPVGLIALMMFGKASFYGLVGRAISRDALHPAAAVLAGGLICLLFFLIPAAGVLLSFLVSVLMLGCGVLTLFGEEKKPVPLSQPAGQTSTIGTQSSMSADPSAGAFPKVEAPTPLEGAEVPPFAAPTVPPPLQATPPPLVAPAIDLATLRRAGFWIRTLSLLIDLVLVAAVFHVFGPFCFILMAAYGAIMWKLKGTTIGGIICGLKVVRLDGRPIDWSTAIARAAGCFLSMIAFDLGFIWVVFDGERQSWHDKIAGTIVVYAPKGASLV